MMRFHPTHKAAKHGFYTKFFIEAATPTAAEDRVVELLKDDPSITDFICNAVDDPAEFGVEKIFEITDWPDCTRPRTGLVWFRKTSTRTVQKRRDRAKT